MSAETQCKGVRLVTGPKGIYGTMSLVCIACGETVSTFAGHSPERMEGMGAAAWIKGAAKAQRDHAAAKRKALKIGHLKLVV